jgi:hypothetical protein
VFLIYTDVSCAEAATIGDAIIQEHRHPMIERTIEVACNHLVHTRQE